MNTSGCYLRPAASGCSPPAAHLRPAQASRYRASLAFTTHGGQGARRFDRLRVAASQGSCTQQRLELQVAGRAAAPPSNARPAGNSSSTIAPPATSSSPVLVAFVVPTCHLQHGEHLRLVGSCEELGEWALSAAPELTWHEGHNWHADVALPPGQHSFKFAVVRKDGSTHWEGDGDRMLFVPKLSGALASLKASSSDGTPAPLFRASCRFGDPRATTLKCMAGSKQLQAVANAAVARVSALLLRKQQLMDKVFSLDQGMVQSESRIVGIEDSVQQLDVLDCASDAEAFYAPVAAAPADAHQHPYPMGGLQQLQQAEGSNNISSRGGGMRHHVSVPAGRGPAASVPPLAPRPLRK